MAKQLQTTTQITQHTDSAKVKEAVIVHFDYRQKDWSLFFEFQDELAQTIEKAGAGEYDGNELALTGSKGSMYIYGPDANAILAIIGPRLRSTSFLANVVITLRYGKVSNQQPRAR